MIETIMNPDFSHAITMALMHSIWQGGLIALTLFLAERNTSLSSLKMYRLSLIGLFLLFVATLVTFSLSYSSHFIINTPPQASPQISITSSPLLNDGVFEWKELVTIAWIFGCFFWGMKSSWGLFSVNKIRAQAILAPKQWVYKTNWLKDQMKLSKKVLILMSERIQKPLVHGILQPAMLFPASYFTLLSNEELESIILHELTHIKHNDFLINIIQVMIESVLFFNPACWWISKTIRKYREYTCDDEVVHHLAKPNTYVKALYHAACISTEKENYAIALFNQKNELTMRIKRMLNHKSNESSARFWGKLCLLVFLSIGFLSFNHFEELKPSSDQSFLKSLDIELGEHKLDFALAKLKPLTAEQISASEFLYSVLPAEIDTTPEISNKRTEELNRQIDEKAKQMEELSEQIAKEVEQKIEFDAQKLEELARQLEEKMEPLTKQLEDDIMSSESMKRLEELEKRIEEKLDKKMLNLERSFSDEEMKKLEKKMEELARKIEEEHKRSEGDSDSDKMKKYNKEMQYLNQQLHERTKEFSKEHAQIMSDPEIKALMEEMDIVREGIEPIQPLLDELMNEEMKTIQEEMNKLQVKINKNMEGFQEGWHDQIKELSKEIEVLSLELVEEYKLLNEKKN